jgi:hypothetical protein
VHLVQRTNTTVRHVLYVRQLRSLEQLLRQSPQSHQEAGGFFFVFLGYDFFKSITPSRVKKNWT